MISLEEAVNIAKEYLEREGLFVRNNCRDLGDSWVFEWGWKNAPGEIDTGGSLLKIRKDNGRITNFDLGLPHEENFKQFMKAPKIDISEYLSKENLELCKVPIQITFPEGITVIESGR